MNEHLVLHRRNANEDLLEPCRKPGFGGIIIQNANVKKFANILMHNNKRAAGISGWNNGKGKFSITKDGDVYDYLGNLVYLSKYNCNNSYVFKPNVFIDCVFCVSCPGIVKEKGKELLFMYGENDFSNTILSNPSNYT